MLLHATSSCISYCHLGCIGSTCAQFFDEGLEEKDNGLLDSSACLFLFFYILFFQGYDEWGSKRLESLQGRSEALGKVLTFLRSLILRNRLERGSTASPPAASDYKLSEVLRLGLWQVNECVYDDFWNLQGFDPQNTVA